MRITLRALAVAALVVIVFALPARADTITDGLSRPLDFTVFAPEIGGPDAVSFSVWVEPVTTPAWSVAVAAVPVTGFEANAAGDAAAAPSSQAIPEPATVLLLGCGLGLLVRSRRRA